MYGLFCADVWVLLRECQIYYSLQGIYEYRGVSSPNFFFFEHGEVPVFGRGVCGRGGKSMWYGVALVSRID